MGLKEPIVYNSVYNFSETQGHKVLKFENRINVDKNKNEYATAF